MAQPHSPFLDIFMAMRQRLIDTASTSLYINQDLGQLRNHHRPPVTWPCVLIDFENFEYENLAENVQTAKGTIVIQLGFAPYSNSTQVTPEQYVQQAMLYYDMEMYLHQIFQGWSPIEMGGALMRTSVTTQRRNDNYRVRELRYSIAFEDYFTKRQLQMVPAELEINEELQIDI